MTGGALSSPSQVTRCRSLDTGFPSIHSHLASTGGTYDSQLENRRARGIRMKNISADDLETIRASMPVTLQGRVFVDSLVCGFPQLGILHQGRTFTAPSFDVTDPGGVDPIEFNLCPEEVRFIAATNDRLTTIYAAT